VSAIQKYRGAAHFKPHEHPSAPFQKPSALRATAASACGNQAEAASSTISMMMRRWKLSTTDREQPMIVIRNTAELAATVRRVARQLPSYRHDTRTDLDEVAAILERLAIDGANPPMIVNTGLNILEDEL